MDVKQIAMQMINNNPQIKGNPMLQNALQMAQKDDREGLKQLAENLAKSNGMSLNEAITKLGL